MSRIRRAAQLTKPAQGTHAGATKPAGAWPSLCARRSRALMRTSDTFTSANTTQRHARGEVGQMLQRQRSARISTSAEVTAVATSGVRVALLTAPRPAGRLPCRASP